MTKPVFHIGVSVILDVLSYLPTFNGTQAAGYLKKLLRTSRDNSYHSCLVSYHQIDRNVSGKLAALKGVGLATFIVRSSQEVFVNFHRKVLNWRDTLFLEPRADLNKPSLGQIYSLFL